MKININKNRLAVICFSLVLVVLLFTFECSFSRMVRETEISWDEFTNSQIQQFRSKYNSWQYIEKRDMFKEDIRAAGEHIPMIIDWVRSIFKDYGEFGRGKLVFLGGAAKKAYQVAKVLSLEYDDIDSSNIVYIDMPREVIKNSSKEDLFEFMRQEGVYDEEAVTFVDVCIDWSQDNDPILRLSEIITDFKPDILISYATLVNYGLSGHDVEKEEKLFKAKREYRGEGLFNFLEHSPRYRHTESLKTKNEKIIPVYKLHDEFSQDMYRARVSILYSSLSREFGLTVPGFLNGGYTGSFGSWKDFTLGVLKGLNRPVTFDEIKSSLGIVQPEDENWFIQAVNVALKSLVKDGIVTEQNNYYTVD